MFAISGVGREKGAGAGLNSLNPIELAVRGERVQSHYLG